MSVELKTNIPVRGSLKYADHFKAKEANRDDRLKLKGAWQGEQDDTIFCSLRVLDQLLALGAVSQPNGSTDKFGNPKYTVIRPEPTIELLMDEFKENGKNKKRTIARLVKPDGAIVEARDAKPVTAPAPAQPGAPASPPPAKPGPLKTDRHRWRVLRKTYRACKAIAESVWESDLRQAIEEQQALAEMMRDRYVDGIAERGEANVKVAAEVPVPLFTPRDRLQFLKEVTTALLIEVSRRGLEAYPEEKKPAAKSAAPALQAKAAEPPPPPPPAPPQGKADDLSDFPEALDGEDLDDLPF